MKSIAVMAFKDLSKGQDMSYLAEGISEELLNLLAQIPNLRVIYPCSMKVLDFEV